MPPSTRQQRADLKASFIARLAELREEKRWSHERIARHLGMSRSWIWYSCLTNGIDKPDASASIHRRPAVSMRGVVKVRAFTDSEDLQLLALAAAVPSRAEIGCRLGRARQTVAARLATLARRDERAMGGVA